MHPTSLLEKVCSNRKKIASSGKSKQTGAKTILIVVSSESESIPFHLKSNKFDCINHNNSVIDSYNIPCATDVCFYASMQTSFSSTFVLNITKTCLCNVDPLKPHFHIVKLGFTGVYIIFLFLLKNIDCGYSLENIRIFVSEDFQFLEVKISIYLNKRVFVMSLTVMDE